MAIARRLAERWRCRRVRPLLIDSAAGALDPDAEAAVRQHVAVCHDCGADLQAVYEMESALRGLPSPERDEAFWLRQRQAISRRIRAVELGVEKSPSHPQRSS